MPARDDVPSTAKRSVRRAREIWSKAHDSAVDTYGEGERAHRTAFAALKHQFRKVGDRWEAKEERGPSDPRAERSTPQSRSDDENEGRVDANASKQELYDIARRLDIDGRSRMNKADLVDAIRRENDRRGGQRRAGD